MCEHVLFTIHFCKKHFPHLLFQASVCDKRNSSQKKRVRSKADEEEIRDYKRGLQFVRSPQMGRVVVSVIKTILHTFTCFTHRHDIGFPEVPLQIVMGEQEAI